MIVLFVCLGLVGVVTVCTLVHRSAYRSGFEDGCRHQRRIVNQVVDKLRAGQRAAERNVDYLYERTRQQIEDLN